ncbi:hypothetical protein ACWD3P_28625 [Streptomyces sp. NPDC002765]
MSLLAVAVAVAGAVGLDRLLAAQLTGHRESTGPGQRPAVSSSLLWSWPDRTV